MNKFSAAVAINSSSGEVWSALTDTDIMAKWMGEPEMEIEVQTDWRVYTPILIRGFHHVKFENKGMVLKYEKEKNIILHSSEFCIAAS